MAQMDERWLMKSVLGFKSRSGQIVGRQIAQNLCFFSPFPVSLVYLHTSNTKAVQNADRLQMTMPVSEIFLALSTA